MKLVSAFPQPTGPCPVKNLARRFARIQFHAGVALCLFTLRPGTMAQDSTFNFEPIDDAYLQSSTLFNDNYLKVRAGSRVSYLKFTVEGLSGHVHAATLRLQENGDTGSGTLRFYRGSHNDWTETNLSTASAPAEAGEVGTFTGRVTSAQIINIDITPLVTADGTYSLIMKQDSGGNAMWFGSSESARKPMLIIETAITLTVNNGSGSGNYVAGEIVNIVADTPSPDQQFDQWTGDIDGIADVHAASTTITMPAADATITASYKFIEGIGDVGPLDGLTATGDRGLVTSINRIPVSGLLLGVTTFPNLANPTFPAENADDFDLNTLGSADSQPFFDCSFPQAVMTIFILENGGNDSGLLRGLDAAGNPTGPVVSFTTDSYFRTVYQSGNGQVVAGLTVRMMAPVHGIRVFPPETMIMGFDPISITASARPWLELQHEPTGGSWQLVWFGSDWVLQHASGPNEEWSDVSPIATSPHVLVPGNASELFRLKEAGPE